MSTLGDRLREARERKGYSQMEVSKRIQINNKTLSRYEIGGSEPDLATLKILASLYEVSVDWLTGNTVHTPSRNTVLESYARLPREKQKLIDDMIKALMDEK